MKCPPLEHLALRISEQHRACRRTATMSSSIFDASPSLRRQAYRQRGHRHRSSSRSNSADLEFRRACWIVCRPLWTPVTSLLVLGIARCGQHRRWHNTGDIGMYQAERVDTYSARLNILPTYFSRKTAYTIPFTEGDIPMFSEMRWVLATC